MRAVASNLTDTRAISEEKIFVGHIRVIYIFYIRKINESTVSSILPILRW